MEVAVTDISDVEKEVSVQVTAQELLPHFEDAYKRESKKIELKGFRKGKAPLDLVKKMFGESIEYDALPTIANDVYRKFTEDKKIEPLGEPVLTDMNYKRGEELRFKVKYEIKPVFELKQYKKIPATRNVYTVSETEVDDELRRLQKANSTLAVATTAEDDEYVVTADVQELDHAGTPLIGKKSPGMKIYLADETVHPDVKNALAKAVVGEVRRASFETERDGAKTQHNISCTIAAVEKVSFPSLDDEFARKLTKGKIQTIADFRTHIREDIQHYWNDVSDRAVMDALIGEIVRRHDFTAPESLVKAITDASIDDVKNQYPGKKLPTDFDEKKFREDFRASAIFQAKWYLIRERIIEIEKVQVEDADLERKAERDAATTAIAKERLISFYKNSKPVLDRILSDKLAAVLKSGATITEKAAEIPK